MKKELKDRHPGIPMSEWISRIPNELPVDAVGLWQIIPAGADSFGLSGYELEVFAKRSIVALIEAGAKPVYASSHPRVFWEHEPKYGDNALDIAENVVDEWKNSPELASHDGLWFDLLGASFCGST